MNKIKQVILKDLKNRLTKRWFWMLSIMGPLIFTTMIMVAMGLNMKTASSKVIEVWQDPKGTLPIDELPKNDQFNYMISKGEKPFQLQQFMESNRDFFLVIPAKYDSMSIVIYQKRSLSNHEKQQINQDLNGILRLKQLRSLIDSTKMMGIDTEHKMFNFRIFPVQSSHNNSAQIVIGLVAAIVIYYFTFSYSVQVMRNVMEEKTNRVVEVILVAMKPWELMTAKILGGSILGVIQFTIWVVLTLSILYPMYTYFQLDRYSTEQIQQTLLKTHDAEQALEINYILSSFQNIQWDYILAAVFLYFVLGYLLYSAMFAAIGASVDQDAETQMFIMPVTAPLAISIVFINFVAQYPDHLWSKFLAIFPLTAPVIAPIKIVTGEMSSLELIASVSSMVGAIVLIIYLAGKIFKAGILNYGSTASWKEIFKWAKE